MSRFPVREPDTIVLAQDMISGIRAHPDIFPAPTFKADELASLLANYTTARDAYIALQSQLADILAQKQNTLALLTDDMKVHLRFAEASVSSDQQLALIGWGGHSAPITLQAPSQPRNLEISRQGEGWVYLDWKQGADGGKPSAYTVQRREMPDGAWTQTATAVDVEITLANQPHGKPLEYRVLAMNRAGESEASNTVAVAL